MQAKMALAESVEFEADKVFDWLDEDGDGYITHIELSDSLNITKAEAKAIIEETQLTLHGSAEASPSLCEGLFHLSRNNFQQVMKAGAQADESLPIATEQRYREVFDSIDIDGKGFITMDDLALATGADESDMAAMPFGAEGQITYADFVQLLRKSEIGRAAKTLLDLLYEMGRGHELGAAVGAMEQAKQIESESTWTPDSSETMSSRSLQTPRDRTPHVSGVDLVPAEQPELSRDDVDDLWESIEDPMSGDVEMDELQVALMMAQSTGTLPLSDGAVVEVVFQLSEKSAAGGGHISSEDFWAVMNKYTAPDTTPRTGRNAPLYRTTTVDSVIDDLKIKNLGPGLANPGLAQPAPNKGEIDHVFAPPKRKTIERAPSGFSTCSADSLPHAFLPPNVSRVPMPIARQASDMEPPKGDTPDGFASPAKPGPRSRVNHVSLHTAPFDSGLRRGDSAIKGGSSLMFSAYLDRGTSDLSQVSMISSEDSNSDSETEESAGPMKSSQQ